MLYHIQYGEMYVELGVLNKSLSICFDEVYSQPVTTTVHMYVVLCVCVCAWLVHVSACASLGKVKMNTSV